MKNLFQMDHLELEDSLQHWVQQEREVLRVVLEHIKEVARRELHLQQGFSNLKDYLVQKYSYSERAAYRRIDVARLLRAVPSLAEKIQDGSMDITKISELSRAVKEKERSTGETITPAQKADLAARISGKTSFESQKELAQALDIPIKDHETKRVQKDESVRVELTLSKSQYEKLMACRDLSAHKLQQEHKDFSLASVIEVLADAFLSDKTTPKSSPSKKVNKTLTPKTRKEVLVRDQCCQYRDPQTGKICGSTFALQVDHVRPQWADGDHSNSNLRALCGAHNQHKYRQESQVRLL